MQSRPGARFRRRNPPRREVVGGLRHRFRQNPHPWVFDSSCGCVPPAPWRSLVSTGPATAAELFYMDRDSFNNQYTGPGGPLVLSGEIVPGDYAKLLARIAEDPDRFLDRNKLILASSDGNAAEAIKIARLLRSLYTGGDRRAAHRALRRRLLPHLCRCERARHGWRKPARHPSRRAGRIASGCRCPPPRRRSSRTSLQAPVRDFLADNEVPRDSIDELFKHPPTDIYWLTEHDGEDARCQVAVVREISREELRVGRCARKAVLPGSSGSRR